MSIKTNAELIALRCLDLNPVALKNVGWKYYIAIDAIIVSQTDSSMFDRCHSLSRVSDPRGLARITPPAKSAQSSEQITSCATEITRSRKLPREESTDHRPPQVLAFIVVYFTYPETSKITLEEVSTIFDGKHAVKNALFEEQVVMEGISKGDDKAVTVERREVSGDV